MVGADGEQGLGDAGTGDVPKKRTKALKPAQCAQLIRERLAESFEDIVTGFVKQAKVGKCQHVKLICELLDSKPALSAVRPKDSAALMLAKLRKHSAETPMRVRGVDGKYLAREPFVVK